MLGLKHCVKSLDRLNQGRQVISRYFVLFAWEMLLRDSTFYLLEGWLSAEVIKKLKGEYNDMIKLAAKDIDHVNESLNIPVHAVYSPIAKNYVLYNEKPYQGEVINARM